MNDDMLAKLGRSRKSTPASAGNSAGNSAVDRLIELASDRKPATKQTEVLALNEPNLSENRGEPFNSEPKDADESAMWKVLLQFKSVLPYVSRLLPLLDLGIGQAQNAGVSNELRQNVTSIQTSQRDVRIAVQDQALQLKRVEDQLTRMREASEKNVYEQTELVEDVKSIGNLVRAVGAGLAVLLVILILMVGALLAHVSH
jgi:hypothetical protein